MAFGWADYLVCGLMLAISSSIGIYYRFSGGKQKTNKEYLLANNDANMVAVAFSLMATFMSSITLLGVSSENYTYGTQFVAINLSYALFTPVAAYLYLPVFYKLQMTSAYEYLERRFGSATRLTASTAFSLQMVLYMGIVVYAPALALEAVTGLSQTGAILVMGIVCTFYATLGGMKAVLVTDVFQSLLMFAAVFSVIISALNDKGWNEIWNIAQRRGRIEFDNFDPDPTVRHTWWSLNFGGGLTFLSLYAVNQAQVQRYLSVKNLETAQKSLFLNWPILSLLSFSTSFAGLCIFSLYSECDPILAKRVSSTDQLMPLYVIDTMGHLPGLSGLFVAGIFSGSLSTVSGALNSLAAVTVEDYVKPLYKYWRGHGLTDKKSVLCSKLLCLGYGGCCLAIAFLSRYLGGILQAALTIFGVVGGPLLGVFTLGMFFPWTNQIGALTAILVSLCFSLFLGFGGPKPPPPVLLTYASDEGCSPWNIHIPGGFTNRTSPRPSPDYMYLYRVSYMWYIVLSFLMVLVVGLLVSLVANRFGHVSEVPHPDLFIPPVSKYIKKKRQKLAETFPFERSTGTVMLNNISAQQEDEQEKGENGHT